MRNLLFQRSIFQFLLFGFYQANFVQHRSSEATPGSEIQNKSAMDAHYSHRTQLLIAAAAASLATAGLISGLYEYSRRKRRKRLGDEARKFVESHDPLEQNLHSNAVQRTKEAVGQIISGISGYNEELIREQLARNYAIFGEEGMESVRKASVVIVGCGGVGSWAAVMLARSGVSNIRLVDFDYVTLSSLNRHATAVLADVGAPKVICIERFLRTVAKWIRVDSRIEIWRKEDGGKLLEGVDWVVDAIDNIETKVDLLEYCHKHDIKVFSSMGAGAKFDPTRVQISDISNTTYDPLARSVRVALKKRGVSSGIPVVYSTEVPTSKLLPLPEEEFQRGDVKELAFDDSFRVRILPVFGPLPSIFGLHIASYIICDLAGKPILNPLPVKNRRKLYEKLLRDLLIREEKTVGETINRLSIDEDDVSYIFEELYRGRSAIPPHDVPNKPQLARWDPTLPLSLDNCVVLDSSQLKKHTDSSMSGMKPSEIWGDDVAKIVEKRSDEARRWRSVFM